MRFNNRQSDDYLFNEKQSSFSFFLPAILFLLAIVVIYFLTNKPIKRSVSKFKIVDDKFEIIETYISEKKSRLLDEIFNEKNVVEEDASSEEGKKYKIADMVFIKSSYRYTGYRDIDMSIDGDQLVYINKGNSKEGRYEMIVFDQDGSIQIVAYTYNFEYFKVKEIDKK